MTEPSAEVRRSMYRTMRTIAYTDERIRGLLMQGKALITYYSPRGQEAIPAAVSAALRIDDYLATNYRGMHDTIAKGAPLAEVLAEILGKATGTCKGKGGIMHLTDPASGVMVTSGVVGAGLPIANGMALGSKLKGEDRVTVCNFGDGATNIGAFHESLNLAAVWRLPVVFVCQNNEYGEFTPRMDSMNIKRISDRADAYVMVGETVDGNDPDEVYRAAVTAVARARAGDGPTLIEATTYRFMGHIFGLDQMAYMPREEYEAAVAADPVPAYRARLIGEGVLDEDTMAALEAEVKAEVDVAVTFALDSPVPDVAQSLTDVFAEVPA
jgi:pyruvate dehydrogenase E1 component alpha subunit